MSDYELVDSRDIIWMKFTKEKRHLGVVATSDDINFDIPVSKENYNDKKENGAWKYLTSGIIIHVLGENWNEDYVFVFPLINKKPDKKRHFYEKQIGDYLIENGIPVLDYYSHRI